MGGASSTSSTACKHGRWEGGKQSWFSPEELDKSKHGHIIDQWRYSEKFCHPAGGDYRGKMNWTKSGGLCQNWGKSVPHRHTFSPSKFKSLVEVKNSQTGKIETVGPHNYCRTINYDGTQFTS